MEIIVGKSSGFCYGVKRAVESAEKDANRVPKNIYCLGEIVHNSDVVNCLHKKGITFVENIDEVPKDSTVIIRAHGVTRSVYEKAKEKNIEVKDYTCPNVLKIHKIVQEYADKGYFIILLGSRKHPENIGTVSYCGEHYFVAQDEDQIYLAIEEIKRWNFDKVLVLAQTTFGVEDFAVFTEILSNELYRNVELVIENTICQATEIRQKETEELSKNVDCIIIIGGKNSSNTKRLYEIALENCKKAVCIENINDLKNVHQYEIFDKIGIMAGTSTPAKSVEDVCNILKNI